jgi:hypothetical protein
MGVGAHRDFKAQNPERRIRLWSYENWSHGPGHSQEGLAQKGMYQ